MHWLKALGALAEGLGNRGLGRHVNHKRLGYKGEACHGAIPGWGRGALWVEWIGLPTAKTEMQSGMPKFSKT